MGTMRDDLLSAMDEDPEDDTNDSPDIPEETSDSSVSDDTQDADQVGEASVNDLEKQAPSSEGGKEDPTGAAGEPEAKQEAAPKADAQESVKAPLDWSPSQRESWSKVPRDIQDKILAREKDMADAIEGTADARKTHEHLSKLATAFAPVMAAEGANTPMEAIEGLFNTVAELRMGSPQQKAVKMASLISHYGVDIAALDSVLAGQTPEQGSNTQLEQMLDQRMQPFNDFMANQQQNQQTQNQATQNIATANVAEFAKANEFMNDVRQDMAYLVDLAAKNGQEITLQQAYDKACTLNPEICAVIDKRKADAALLGDQTSIAAKEAAMGLNGKQMGTGGGAASMSLREQINSAWDNAG